MECRPRTKPLKAQVGGGSRSKLQRTSKDVLSKGAIIALAKRRPIRKTFAFPTGLQGKAKGRATLLGENNESLEMRICDVPTGVYVGSHSSKMGREQERRPFKSRQVWITLDGGLSPERHSRGTGHDDPLKEDFPPRHLTGK
ncbi:hypothetical protein Nepgr_029123 [Nepenthes gracilis]|uniref:Uncharacterized protein n=1 Tax=Nepenthes gracilis TaxID=150966 RepID=A0AAD3TCZ7_NEPGR|nr:hypothetical protein Nepgr_029123 [Nepenthes gracilis]